MAPSAASRMRNIYASEAKETYLSTYARLLINRRDRYLARNTHGGWFSSQRRPTNRLLESALRGNTALGLYATAEDGTSKWLCLDADDDAFAHKLHAAAKLLPDHTFFIERSRRGLHVYRLFDPPAPWSAVQRYGVTFAHKAGCDSIEVFPKNGTFSAVRAPMTRHPTTMQLYDWLDPHGTIIDPWATLLTLTPTPIPDHWLCETEKEKPQELPRALPFGQLTAIDEHDALVELASHYTTLKPNGPRSFIGKCMFHTDHRPSFGILNGYWRCWSQCLGSDHSAGGLNALRARLRDRGLLRD